jgi:hypothetical protein
VDEHHQHYGDGQHSAQVHEHTVQSDDRGREDSREDGDAGRVGTFEAKAEERGKNAETLGRNIQGLSDTGHLAGFYIYAWQRQVAGFYGMRLRKNVEFGRRLAEVDGIADLIGAQREYVRDMLLDYASGFCSLYGLPGPQQTVERVNR